MDTQININNEIWRPIEGYEGLYEVSNHYRIKRVDTNRIQKERIDPKRNRRYCGLWKNNKGKTKYVYILVAKAFPEICGEWFEGCEVHHKDFNRLNDVPGNLQVLSVSEHRELHSKSEITKQRLSESHKGQVSWRKGKHLKSPMEGKRHTEESKDKIKKNSPLKKAVVMLNSDGEILNMFESTMDAERQTGVNHSNIEKCCNKKPHYLTAGGYVWRWADLG